jgi:hypothetical protein
MAETATSVPVQVCYALPDRQILRSLVVRHGATLHEAIKQSGILFDVPEIDLTTSRVGIHGKLKTLETVLRAGDRIEIYRPLLADPKDARRKRAGRKVQPVAA